MAKEIIGIPQHLLRNRLGQPVHFELIEWGEVHNYDFLKAHRHQFYEILFFANGNARHDIDFKTYKATTGAIHFVASDNVHLVLRNKNSVGYSLLFTTDYFSDDIIGQLPFAKSNPILHPNKSDFKRLYDIASQIKAELSNNQNYSSSIIKASMEIIAFYLIRIFQTGAKSDDVSLLPEHIKTFKQLVKGNLLKHYSVEEYADNLGISSKHLIELCKKHTGKTPLKYIQEQTICEAKRQLFHTNFSVKEIAYGLGFDDPANFSKYFKSFTGYSPAAYRKGNR
ncbi:MAG: AraC family transcriptional regulator [Bacteroidota bacterium]